MILSGKTDERAGERVRGRGGELQQSREQRMASRPAKKSAARSFVTARGAPDSLQSFLGGMSLPASEGAAEDASMIEVNLKLLQKNNETTLMRALSELKRLVTVVAEEGLLSYIPNIIEAVLRHAEHTNASVRAGMFNLVRRVVGRGGAAREELARGLPLLAVAWVARMNDMETTVRTEARAAFTAAFSPEVLHTHADAIVEGLIDAFATVIEQGCGKPLQDDSLDRRSNVLYSSVCAMGYMMEQPVVARQKIVEFVERNELQPILPARGGSAKGSLVARAPTVRSAPLFLLCHIVRAKLVTPQIHRCISKALYDAVLDEECVVVRRVWELVLLWCRENTQSAAAFFHEDFLRDVASSFTRSCSPEMAEVIYPSIVPLLVPLTRESRRADIILDFGNALLQKLEHFGDVTLHEWRLVLSALMQSWDLFCVRAVERGEGHEKDGAMLFHRILVTLVTVVATASKQTRYLQTAVSVAAPSITRVARHSECFCECVRILCGHSDALFHVLPDDAGAALCRGFDMLQAGLVGAVVAALASSNNMSEVAEGLIERYTREKLWEPLAELLRACADHSGVGEAVVFLPAKSVRRQAAEGLIDAIKQDALMKRDEGESEERTPLALFEELLLLVLRWDDKSTRESLQTLLADAPSDMQWVSETVRRHDMRDPERLLRLFLQACEEADFTTLDCCLSALDNVQRSLSTLEKEQLRHAVQRSMESTLRLVGDEDEEGDGVAATAGASSRANSSATSEGSEEDDFGNDDDDEEEEGEEEEEENNTLNRGVEVLQRLVTWSDLLRKGERLATLLDFSGEDLNLPTLFRAVVAVAPRLQAETYISIKALRVTLQDEDDPLLQAMAKKTHSLGVGQFNTLLEHVESLLDSYGVSVEQRDTVSLELFDEVMRDSSCGLAACNQLSRLLPFASNALMQGVACSAELWAEHQVPLREKSVSTSGSVPYAMLDRYCSLDVMQLSMLRCVRTAQLVHLIGVSVPIETCDAVAVTLPLLRAARIQEALADQIRKMLMKKLLPRALQRLWSQEEVAALLAGDAEPHLLLCTLAGVLCDVAPYGNDALVTNARCIASVVTQWIVDALLFEEGTAPVHAEAIAAYRAFFASLDEMADVVGDFVLSSVAPRQAAAVQEAMCMLPTLESHKALLIMTIHRHLNTAPVVIDKTVRQIIAHAQNQRPLEGLELLAELASSRILDTMAYNGLVNTITHMMACVCRLRHMPPNGRLVSQAPNELPLSLKDLCRVVVAAVSARRGAILHGRIADILRSSVNLILFDAVTECVVSLRQTREEDVSLVTRLIAFTSNCLSDLITSDVAVLRASEMSVVKVANVMHYAYQWLCATPIAKLENIGIDTVVSSIRAVALLSHLTLLRSAVVLLPIMRQITGKRQLKNLRTEFSTRSPAKVNSFIRHAAIIAKTNKQKLTLFLHLLAWCVTLSGPVSENVTKERREEVFHLLDLLCSLLLARAVPGSGARLDGTFLCTSCKAGGENLGFETVALTRPNAPDPMKELAKGAAATFALLLQSSALPIVKNWLETIEEKLMNLFYTFVETHVSPLLVQESLLAVLGKSASGQPTFDVNENYTVSVSLAKKRITLKYTMEDASVAVQIAFPGAFPLKNPTVTHDTRNECGVSMEKWRSWMLKMTGLLFGGSSNIWECVTLFGRNLDGHFAGQEPCPICFAVVSAVGNRLPDMRCGVCRNAAFHSSCLNAWWANSKQTVCPLCRSSWVST